MQNEWAAGRRRVVARLALNGRGEVGLAEGDDRWSSLLRPLRDPQTGEEVLPDQGERFIRLLHVVLDGDYLFATEAHEEGDCDYHVDQEFEVTSRQLGGPAVAHRDAVA